MIDGGKGQLAAALAAMREFDLPRVAVVALAKREEEVFVPGRASSVRLPRDSAGLLLLQRIPLTPLIAANSNVWVFVKSGSYWRNGFPLLV